LFLDGSFLLGVSKNATKDEIRKAFRKLARQYHPDVAKDKATADQKFKDINEAYEVLSDPQKRSKYDQLGSAWNQPGAGMGSSGGPRVYRRSGGGGMGGLEDLFRQFGGGRRGAHFEGTGFSDFFESFFGGGGGGSMEDIFGGRAQQPQASQRGQDIQGDLLVTLEEVLRGAVREIRLKKENSGQGESLKVWIPAGVREGQRLRIPGKGAPSPTGGEPGNVYLRVRYARHPHFRAENSDLKADLPLAPWEATLGTKVTVPTLEGPTVMRIQPGTQNGTHMRLRGKGLPKGDKERGDLYFTVEIRVPENLGEKEKKAWEKLARESSFRARD